MGSTIFIIILFLLLLIGIGFFFAFGRMLAKARDAHDNRTDEEIAAEREQHRSYGGYREYVPATQTAIDEVKFARRIAMGITAFIFVLMIVIIATSVTTVVPTKEIGVELTLQKPSGTLSNGFHLKYPWQQIKTIDAAIQIDNHLPGGKSSDGSEKLNCVTVRIAHQATACIDASIRWQAQERTAGKLYQNYRDFDRVRDSLVTRDLTAALGQEFETYDPLAVDPTTGQSTAPQFSVLAQKVVADMNNENGGLVQVLQISIPVVRFDPSTNSKIQQIQQQIAQTNVAKQAIQTATNQAEANKQLAQSLQTNPQILQQHCLDTIEEAIKAGASLPATLNCGFGSSGGVLLNVPAGK